jgi:Uncharacterized protein conserved in bacteria (DUF2332)
MHYPRRVGGGRRNASPFGQIMPCAGSGPARLVVTHRGRDWRLPGRCVTPSALAANVHRLDGTTVHPPSGPWPETLIWPEHEHRRRRLAGALPLAATAGVRIERGDAHRHRDTEIKNFMRRA